MAVHAFSPALRRDVAARFRALGDETRLALLQHLIASGPLSVGELAAAVGSGHANVSKHLRILDDAGLVTREKRGTSAYYAVADPNLEAICDLACARLVELARIRTEEYSGTAAG